MFFNWLKKIFGKKDRNRYVYVVTIDETEVYCLVDKHMTVFKTAESAINYAKQAKKELTEDDNSYRTEYEQSTDLDTPPLADRSDAEYFHRETYNDKLKCPYVFSLWFAKDYDKFHADITVEKARLEE